MGLFDKFLKKSDAGVYTPSDEYEAWLGILMACLRSDGDADKLEIHALARMIVLKKKFKGYDIAKYLPKVQKGLDSVGGLGMVEACSKLVPQDDRNTVFTMAVEIVLADGSLDQGEVTVINALANEMGLPKEMAQKIVDVMLIRNKGNYALA